MLGNIDFNLHSEINLFHFFQVVAVFANEEIVSKILSNVESNEEFVFIGADAWGPAPILLENGGGEKSRGSLILSFESTPELNYNVLGVRINAFNISLRLALIR